jgi:hypothetical protein
MEAAIIYSDFKTLRAAYIEVKKFITTEVGVKNFSLKTTIESDLGCAGDDNFELLEKFVIKYNLDFTGFEYSKHFLSEGELMQIGYIPIGILSMFIYLIAIIAKTITFNKIDFTKFQLLSNRYRQTLDMTFGDMLMWYLTGKYTLRNEIKIRLKGSI